MKTRYIIAPIVILAILVLAAFSTPAMAQACLRNIYTPNCNVTPSEFTNGTITNGSVRVLENEAPGCDNNWTITLPPGEVVVAYAHWHRWGACENNSPTAEFWNGDGVHQQISIPDTLCNESGNNERRGVWYSGYNPDNGNHHYYWRVNATPGTNIFKATGCYDTSGEHCDIRYFVAVINQTDAPNRTHSGVWWHNYGYKKITQTPYSTWFYNASIGPVSEHNYTLWVAQSHYDDSDIDISVNNHLVGTIYGPGGYPFSLEEFNVPGSYIETDGSQAAEWDMGPPDDYFYGYFATLAEKGPERPDLEVEDIIFPEVMNPSTGYTIEATIKNPADAGTGDTFNVSLEVDGIFHSKVTDEGPLSAGASTTVSFTGVSLEEGCHNFTVIADCDNDVDEGTPGETNNARTEWYTVGHNVIVVHNNSDLMSHPDFINRGGTYYLENKMITNCVGCGVTIENTNLPFVIQNCTVHNCNYEERNPEWGQYKAGICLNNVTNGQIGKQSNTIVNNTNAGIRVQNSTYVDIIDNYIRNNTIYGIYVYPDELVKPPYPEYVKFINVLNNTLIENEEGVDLAEAFYCTVSDNIVRDNTKYGVYICGNNSCIYNNTIENNSMYGMKLFNASGNCVCRNDFVNNNNTGVQAYDNRGTNYWNSTVDDIVYEYSGTTYVNYTGNNWSDYTGADNGEGLGSSAYEIDGGAGAEDNYPLIEQRSNYELMCGDVNADGFISTLDATKVDDVAWKVITPGALTSQWAADTNCNSYISTLDANKVKDVAWHVILPSDLGCCNCCTHYHY